MYVVKTLQVFLGLGQILFAYFLPTLLLEIQVDFIIFFAVICNAIKNNTSLMTVNLSGCSLTWRGADTLAKVIRVSGT